MMAKNLSIIDQSYQELFSVGAEVEFEDPEEKLDAGLVEQAESMTNELAAYGTTTSVLLAQGNVIAEAMSKGHRSIENIYIWWITELDDMSLGDVAEHILVGVQTETSLSKRN
ncbi:RuBisCO large subunit-binding protein subunit beta, chloroplastic [Melia azedarach]|uniref:RuBisCO large subunit-binding protein subunit beta, chloroplastic n=1 Tax=Melia azedarach TaxID=155640 RepID=A0ACC1Y556_MELAZ|nr:RuBisCO large subunit-binding protein subunit beta, chloroplastic [Melia azedarach]